MVISVKSRRVEILVRWGLISHLSSTRGAHYTQLSGAVNTLGKDLFQKVLIRPETLNSENSDGYKTNGSQQIQ
jgi:hypothetical protein